MSPGRHTHCGTTIQRALRRGAVSLAAEARQSVTGFLLAALNPDGGFRGRSPASDLYYTVFALECAAALDITLPAQTVRSFVEAAAREPQDYVHLTCLARCRERLWPAGQPPSWAGDVHRQLASHGCPSGGFHREPNRPAGTIYESFLGMLASESLAVPFPHPAAMASRLDALRKSHGGYVNGDGLAASTTPVTAAALALHHELGHAAPPETIGWLLDRQFSRGGFGAASLVPLPDLLSTATAVHALRTLGRGRDIKTEACFEFVTSLWDDSGGFVGHRLDRTPDCEYTFYALLALGNLVEDEGA